MLESKSKANVRGFVSVCCFEAALGLLAVLLGVLLQEPVLATLRWSATALLSGALATLPMLAVFCLLLVSPGLAGFRREVEDLVIRLFTGWNVSQLALISLLAGFGEELFFRALIQGGLGEWVGEGTGLVIGSVLFGLAHCVNRIYAVAATLIGVYLGGLWLWSDNLLTPVTAHALYDFMALVWFVRCRRATTPRRDSQV